MGRSGAHVADRAADTSDRARSPVVIAATIGGIVIACALVGSVFLSPFLHGEVTTPYGYDTPHYIWRSNLVIAKGLDGLHDLSPTLRVNLNSDRPAYPVFASLVNGVLGFDPAWLAYVVPPIFAICVGLAAGAFALEVLEEPPWAFPIYVVLVGASLFVVRTAVGSADNLQVDSVLIAGAAATLLFAVRRRAGAAAFIIFFGAFLIHWIFAGLFMALMLGVALVLVPHSYRRWTRGDSVWSTPSARIGAVGGAALAGAFLALSQTPEFAVKAPTMTTSGIEEKYAVRIPLLRLPLHMAVAAGGLVALWWPRSTLRRFGMAFLGLWALSIPAGFAMYTLRKHHFPIYRVAEFALALPMLASALAVGAIRLGWATLRIVGAAIGVVLVGIAIVATMHAGRSAWIVSPTLMEPSRVQQVATAATYLDAIQPTGPVIFLSSLPVRAPADRVIRAGVPGALVGQVRLFVGRGEDLLAGRETAFPARTLIARASKQTWEGVQPILDQDYVAIYLSAFNPLLAAPPQARMIAPGVYVVRGPATPATVDLAPLPAPDHTRLITSTIAVILYLGLIGLGWSAGLIDAGWLGRVGLAPAFGLAVLTVFAAPIANLGHPFSSTTTWVISLGAALAGWAVFAGVRVLRQRRGGARTDAPPPEPDPAGAIVPQPDPA